MNKKFLFILLAGTILSVSSVSAKEAAVNVDQNAMVVVKKTQFDRKHHQEMAAKLAADLELTDEQKAQAEKIRQQGHEKIAPLMDQMMSLRQKIDQERRDNMQEFEKILTPEQKEKFELLKHRERRFHEGPKDIGKGKMMRGIHKIGPDADFEEAPDEEILPPPPPHAEKYWSTHHDKHHKKMKENKKRHKNKGGFVGPDKTSHRDGNAENYRAVKKGGFVDDPQLSQAPIDNTNVYQGGGFVDK